MTHAKFALDLIRRQEPFKTPEDWAAFTELQDVFSAAVDVAHVLKDNPAMALGLCGTALFLRELNDLDPTTYAKAFDWVCVPVIGSGRTAFNRDRVWYETAKAGGVTITTFDWLPSAETWERGFQDVFAFTASVGGRAVVLDAERSFRGERQASADYVGAAMGFGRAYGLKVGFTSYGAPWNIPDLPWDVFCGGTDFAIPQTYDPDGNYNGTLIARANAFYRSKGARCILQGLGAYQKTGGTPPYRWRTAAELERHLALVPPDVCGAIAWPLGVSGQSHVPESVYRTLGAWTPPGARLGVRSLLKALLPFGQLTDEC